jgi:hypothetical protein
MLYALVRLAAGAIVLLAGSVPALAVPGGRSCGAGE